MMLCFISYFIYINKFKALGCIIVTTLGLLQSCQLSEQNNFQSSSFSISDAAKLAGINELQSGLDNQASLADIVQLTSAYSNHSEKDLSSDFSFEDRLYSAEHSPPKIEETPLFGVVLTNQLVSQDGIVEVCDGNTNILTIGYFPKTYQLNERVYLVEQVCGLGAYNTLYSYFLYQLPEPLGEVDLQMYSREQYERDQKGYFTAVDTGEEVMEVPQLNGMITPLRFERYRPDDDGTFTPLTSNMVGGRRLYDTETQVLSIFSKARGMADCGTFARYQLTEDNFELMEYRYKDCCSTAEECQDPNYLISVEEYPQIYP